MSDDPLRDSLMWSCSCGIRVFNHREHARRLR
jgi:hypothetical protein